MCFKRTLHKIPCLLYFSPTMSCVRLTCVFVCLCLIYEWLLGVWTWFSVNVTHSSKHNNNQKCLCVFSLCLWTCWVFAVWMCIYFLIVMTYTHFRQVVCAFVFACGTCCAGPTAAGQKHCIELNVKTNIKHKLNNNQPPCPLCSQPHTLHTLLYNVSFFFFLFVGGVSFYGGSRALVWCKC